MLEGSRGELGCEFRDAIATVQRRRSESFDTARPGSWHGLFRGSHEMLATHLSPEVTRETWEADGKCWELMGAEVCGCARGCGR